MSANTLANIQRACGNDIAKGMKSFLYIARRDEVTTVPAPAAGTLAIAGNLTMRAAVAASSGPPAVEAVPAGTFKRWDASPVLSKNTWLVEQEGDDVFNYKTTVTYFIPGISPEKEYILSGAPGCEFVIIALDKQGNKRLVGDNEEGASVTWVESSNGDTAGYTITAVWNSAHPPYFYNGTIAAA